MLCVVTSNLFAPSFSCPYSAEVCHYIIFLVATNNCFSPWQLCHEILRNFMSRQETLWSRQIFLLWFLSLAELVCRDIELYVVTQLPWSFSSLLQLLSRPTFLCHDIILSFLSFLLLLFFLCCSSASCLDREFTSFMFCLSRHK